MDGKRVLVIEKNQIIGHHLITLLKQKGHDVYNEVLRISELEEASEHFSPQVIFINKKLFYENENLLTELFREINSVLFVVLFALNPESSQKFSFSNLQFIEIPFMNYEITDLVSLAS